MVLYDIFNVILELDSKADFWNKDVEANGPKTILYRVVRAHSQQGNVPHIPILLQALPVLTALGAPVPEAVLVRDASTDAYAREIIRMAHRGPEHYSHGMEGEL
jgi:hypothetical protein